MVGLELTQKSTKDEASLDVAILFIGARRNSFFHGVFIFPIGNSTCSTTHVAMKAPGCGIM